MREFTARCGARLLIPAGWITASDREPSSQPAEETLYLVGDFNADVIDTASLRRVRAPPDADTWLDGSLPAAEVAQRLTAAEREAVAAGTAVVSLAGVVGATTGTLSFALLSSAKEVRQDGRFYFTVETQQRQCRGTITEGSGGTKQCTGPNGACCLHTAQDTWCSYIRGHL
jgi:hypothetical protein